MPVYDCIDENCQFHIRRSERGPLSKVQRDQLDDAWGKQNRENKDIRGWKGLIFILKRETAAVLEQNIFPQMEVFAVPVFFCSFFYYSLGDPLYCVSAPAVRWPQLLE
jgi:hypothetical protein